MFTYVVEYIEDGRYLRRGLIRNCYDARDARRRLTIAIIKPVTILKAYPFWE